MYNIVGNIIEINNKKIGIGFEPYIVAEMSGNHNGKIENALRLIKKAKEAGADAIKLQTYKANTITINHNSPEFLIEGGLWDGRNLYDLYEEAHTPWDWHKELFEYAKEIDITIFSSPFDETAIDLLEELNTPAYKIASPEIVDLNLIKKAASTGKPIIFSTGMASKEEIKDALEAILSENNKQIIVLHCTSAYPTPLDETNLSTLVDIQNSYKVLTGLSDHTLGTKISSYACLLGACFIEKHFTLDRNNGGVDSTFSIEPEELKKLVKECKEIKNIMGYPNFNITKSELAAYKARRSIYVVKNIKKGEFFTKNNIRSIRPGNGIKPKYIDKILGLKASKDIKFGEPLSTDMINNFS
ncbi:pseudaminic acid synthase [Prochlorococcus sp. AH-716-D13]|nr:pseudaminic acid synthase [Prochlorococcus sp. AH-716-D13]